MKERYLTIEEASRRYRLSPEAIQEMADSGKIKTAYVNDRLIVSEVGVAIMALQAHATDDEIVSISEAARRLDIHPWYIVRWISYGWVPVLGYGPRRAKMISLRRVEALARLQRNQGLRGRRLIPRGQEATVLS